MAEVAFGLGRDRDTLAIASASECAAASLGYSRDELLALSLADVHPPSDAARALAVLSSARGPLRLGAEPGPPWRLARKDGSIAEAEIESDEIEPAGRACRFLIWQERRDALEAFELRSMLVRIEVSDTGLGVEPAVLANAASADGRTDAHAHASVALGRASALFAALGATVESQREPELGSFVWVDVPLRIAGYRPTAASDEEALAQLRAAA